ncbi:MAG: 5-formyltetrahydrofolate cyclo-ligase [Peptococcaceae bacterium]|nr:5-formyltetrahydrofolate cyclo-ligase [Peptococcaceae bacterium]
MFKLANITRELEKKIVRKAVLSCRDRLSAAERSDKSRLIQERIIALAEYREARSVLLFLNFRTEVETTALAEDVLARGKILVIPRCTVQCAFIPAIVRDLTQDVALGTWGIREPRAETTEEIDPRQIDLAIVPGVAFDMYGRRVGYGAGYYDRFLPLLRPEVPLLAAAFECQLLAEVPTEEHDRRIHCLITEDRVIRCAAEHL